MKSSILKEFDVHRKVYDYNVWTSETVLWKFFLEREVERLDF